MNAQVCVLGKTFASYQLAKKNGLLYKNSIGRCILNSLLFQNVAWDKT